MDEFLNKVKKLERKHQHELAMLCGSMAFLLLVSVFVASGMPSKVYAWIIYIYPISYTPVITGGYTTITWNAPTSDGCAIYGPTLPCRRIRGVTACYTQFNGASGAVYTGPINSPITYTISCYNQSGGIGSSDAYGSNSITVYPTAPTPTTITSFTATPSSITNSGVSQLNWSGTRGTFFNACLLTGGQWGGGTWYSALPGTLNTTTLTPGTYTYNIDCFDTNGGSTGWHNATVTVTAPVGPCTDIPASPNVPTGCVGPVPQPLGSCIPAGGSYSAPSNSCTCPANKHLAGTSCVNNPLCSNGLNDSYAPSCTCPAHQYQPLASATCVPLPICSNGLSEAYSPSCTCPSGQVQLRGGSTCVLPGVINSLTANPSRVLAGKSTTITWSTTRMATCTLSAFDNTGTTQVSSALSSSASATVGSATIFTLSCVDEGGLDYSSSVKVNLIPKTSEI